MPYGNPTRRTRFGWLYRNAGQINVRLRKLNGEKVEASFDNNEAGAQACADWITDRLASDNWELEDMAFLGFRIVISVKSDRGGTS